MQSHFLKLLCFVLCDWACGMVDWEYYVWWFCWASFCVAMRIIKIANLMLYCCAKWQITQTNPSSVISLLFSTYISVFLCTKAEGIIMRGKEGTEREFKMNKREKVNKQNAFKRNNRD